MSHTVQHAPKHFQGFPGGGKTYMHMNATWTVAICTRQGANLPRKRELTDDKVKETQARTHRGQSERDRERSYRLSSSIPDSARRASIGPLNQSA